MDNRNHQENRLNNDYELGLTELIVLKNRTYPHYDMMSLDFFEKLHQIPKIGKDLFDIIFLE